MRSRAALLILLMALLSAACGKKGPPLPPLPPYPADAGAPQARQSGETVDVRVSVPGRRMDGEPIERLAGVRIFRQVVAAPEGTTLPAPSVLPGDVLHLARFLSEIELDGLVPGRAWVFTESLSEALQGEDPQIPHRLAYRVRYLLQGKRWSPHTPPAILFTGPPVPAPQALTAQPENDGIRLRWQSAGSDLESAIFRRQPEGAYPYDPLTVVPPGTGDWLDPTVAVGSTYQYEIRSRSGEEKGAQLSAPAGPVVITMEDRFPPAPPGDVQALERPGGVDLFWRAGSEIDLAGYHVWRRQLPAGDWQIMTGELLSGTAYSDEGVEPGVEYEYAVTAVDGNSPANESERSTPLAAQPLAPPPEAAPEKP